MNRTVTMHHHQKVIPYRQQPKRKYPNAAEPGYRFRRYLDLVLAAGISLGSVTTLFCILTMW